MKNRINIAILIMAAGESSRMKDIKQLLPWKGTNLLLHSLNILLEVQQEHIYMVLGANSDVIKTKTRLASQPVVLIENDQWRNGLGSSISHGVDFVLKLEHQLDGILICLADQPLLTSEYYKEILQVFKAGDMSIVATKYQKKPGVPAIFDIKIARELIHLKEDFGARYVMSKYKDKMIVLDADEQTVDIDTQEVYNTQYKKYNSEEK